MVKNYDFFFTYTKNNLIYNQKKKLFRIFWAHEFFFFFQNKKMGKIENGLRYFRSFTWNRF